MPQLRTDYTSRSVSLIPPNSGNPSADDSDECNYCKGKESSTPPAELVLIDRFGGIVKTSDSEEERQSDWVARVFKSPRPIIFEDPSMGYSDEPLLAEPATGSHYIVITSPKHEDAFHSAPVNQISNGLLAMQEQMKTLYQGKGISYVAAYSNYRPGKGRASHPQIELLSINRIPPTIERELEATDEVYNELSLCPMCRIVNVETGGPRQILSTDSYVAFVPWAPIHDMEFWIVPRKHQRSFLKMTQNQLKELALMMRCTIGGLVKLKSNGLNYSVSFHTAPERKQQSQYHWHIEVHPSDRPLGALEAGFGVYVMDKPPEAAAEKLGRSSRREMAELLGVK
ncbi:MAG: galactose-1-phosphate uridylyltransferase [Conexivisphaerales archaeon]